MSKNFELRLKALARAQAELLERKNQRTEDANGIYSRYKYPVLTAAHMPLFWRYDLNEETNPHLIERYGINAVFNSGAIRLNE